MNTITISGILKRGDRKYAQGHEYHLDVSRKSGTIDSLLVLHSDENLPEGLVTITGKLRAEYIHGLGVPAYIAPDTIEVLEEQELAGQSEAIVTGVLKSDPKCRNTHTSKVIASVLLRTEEGMIPAILWGGNARKAEDNLKAGDTITVIGRLQSREYPDKKGVKHTTYELSASKVEV